MSQRILQAEPEAKSRPAGNNRVRLEAARRTIEELALDLPLVRMKFLTNR